ncbi:zinc finger protein 831 isoform X2 [Rhinatrema bivittatum]|uniref:zinc finger protein 831 isoform X2 n=1 Tax=Rhinatrema bivittatum TaxID=194408 RepID=UPI00112951C9|nr:zinc finger protein 831 isoform X2 [Rhinatrema bivittatum]
MEAERTRCIFSSADTPPLPAPAVYVKALTVPFYQLQLPPPALPVLLQPLAEGCEPQPLALSLLPALTQPSPGPRSAGRHRCPHCGRDCLKPSVLQKHVRSHTGERPFPCTTCRVAFKTQSNLYKHRRTQTHVHNARLAAEPRGREELEEQEEEDEDEEEDEEENEEQQQPPRPRPRPPARKCESTDSGYLSHADSAELQGWACSPLHSLSEHGPDTHTLPLEKKKLEEHISKLISQNKALVDDTQLDNVRPRKTALSKQGSIDLPMPYTYKDSFHFDIKPLDGGRKKPASLCAAQSTFAPLGKSKALFFHSVPTQFSTTIDCVPVARSNSVPLVESTKTLLEKPPFLTQHPLNASFSTLLCGNRTPTLSVDTPNSHPRGLVRQAAVDEMQLNNASDYPPSEETRDSKKQGGEASTSKCKATSRKCSQKKSKMFSQDKWQIYGDETFKKLYQKITNSESAKKSNHDEIPGKELTSSHPDLKKLAQDTAVGQHTDGSVPGLGSFLPSVEISSSLSEAVQSKHVSGGSQTAAGGFTEQMETSQPTDLGGRTRKKTPSVQEPKRVTAVGSGQRQGSRPSSPTSSNVLASQPQQAPNPPNTKSLDIENAPLRHTDLQYSHPEKQPDLNILNLNPSDIPCCRGEKIAQEGCHQASTILMLHDDSSHLGNDQESEKLPSERKKLKVEELQSGNNAPLQPAPTIEESSGTYGAILIDSVASSEVLENEEKKLLEAEADVCVGNFEGLACENPVKNMSETLDSWDDLKPVLDSDDTLSSIFCSAFQAPVLPRESDQVSTKQGGRTSSCSIHRSADEAGNCKSPAPVQQCLSAGIKQQDFGEESLPEEKTFSPKYLLKLPHAEAPSDLQMIPKREQEKSPSASEDPYSSPSASFYSEPAAGSLFPVQSQLSYQPRPKELRGDAWPPQAPSELSMPSKAKSASFPGHGATCSDGKNSKKLESSGCLQAESRDIKNEDKIEMENVITEACSMEGTGEDLSLSSAYAGSFVTSSSGAGQTPHLQKANSVFIVTSGSRKSNKRHPADGWRAGYTSPCTAVDRPLSSQYPVSQLEKPSYFGHSFGSFYCHTVTTQQRGSNSLPKRSLTFHSGNTRVSTTKVSFPCLNTEPRITWCCLTRSLPLPTEQKEKADSAYSALQVCRKNADEQRPRHNTSVLDVKITSKAVSHSLTATGSLKTLVSSLSLGPQKQRANSESTAGALAEEEGIPCRKEKLPRNGASGERTLQEMKVTKTRYRRQRPGSAHFKARWLGKQRLPNLSGLPLAGQNRRRRYPFPTSRARGMVSKRTLVPRCSRKQTPASAAKIASGRALWDKEKAASLQVEPCSDSKTVVQGSDRHFGPIFSDHTREKDNAEVQESLGLLDEGMISDLAPRPPAASSPQGGSSPTCASSAEAASAPQAGTTLDIDRSAALPSVLHQELTAESKQNPQSDLLNSSFWPSYPDNKETRRLQQQQTLDSAVVGLASLEPKVKSEKPRKLNVESQGQSLTALNPSQSTLERKDGGSEIGTSPQQGTLPGHVTAPERRHSKTSVEGCSATSSHTSTEAASKVITPSTSQACMGKFRTSSGVSSRLRRHPEMARTTSESRMSPFSLPESIASSEKPSKTLKKRSLELMRNQTRVEYNDSSSDDEGRLVIEI